MLNDGCVGKRNTISALSRVIQLVSIVSIVLSLSASVSMSIIQYYVVTPTQYEYLLSTGYGGVENRVVISSCYIMSKMITCKITIETLRALIKRIEYSCQNTHGQVQILYFDAIQSPFHKRKAQTLQLTVRTVDC
jgi:hypothetical protein